MQLENPIQSTHTRLASLWVVVNVVTSTTLWLIMGDLVYTVESHLSELQLSE